MHKILNWRFVAGAAVVVLALCAVLFLYVRWDLQRFTESLGETPSVSSQGEAREEKKAEQPSPTPAVESTSVSEKQQTQESDSMQVVLDAETTGADPEGQELSEAELDALLEMFEQQALSTLREAVDAADEELDNTELVEAIEEEYGPSPEVNILSEMMARIDAGTATLDNLIEMVEASTTIMPEKMSEGMGLLEMLRRAKASGGLMVVDGIGDQTLFITGAPVGAEGVLFLGEAPAGAEMDFENRKIDFENRKFFDQDGNPMGVMVKPKAVIK